MKSPTNLSPQQTPEGMDALITYHQAFGRGESWVAAITLVLIAAGVLAALFG